MQPFDYHIRDRCLPTFAIKKKKWIVKTCANEISLSYQYQALCVHINLRAVLRPC